MAKFNELENFFEIEMSPNKMRDIAAEIESRSKSDGFLPGQVIRYKINHKFAFTFKPDRISMNEKPKESEIPEEFLREFDDV